MPPKQAAQVPALNKNTGRPEPGPGLFEAGTLSDRSLAVRFKDGPWIRPTVDEVAFYGEVLGSQPVRPFGEWFYQCDLSGKVRFTERENDRLGSRLGNQEEQEKFQKLFVGDLKSFEPKIFTYMSTTDALKAMRSTTLADSIAKSIAPPSVDSIIPADVMPIDIAPTPFAHAYSSRALATMADKFPILSHVNCSYLSTFHHAPTLIELKQHAQALTVLIEEMSGPSTTSAQINNQNLGTPGFVLGEPFDWLNDLSKPYVNTDAPHNIPLSTLMNTYHHDPKLVRTTQICPLSSIPRTKEAKTAGQPGLPYMTHEELTKHANECLEVLDHEFSAEGGLLAILPDMEKVADRGLSDRTILGQLILFTQRLVQRVHELELRAANAADLLSGEKVIPRQTRTLLPGVSGKTGTRPAPVAYPQDKYILANAGDDAWAQLTRLLNAKEKKDRDIHNFNVQNGLSASSQWENNKMMDFRNGITQVDIVTRYTRIWDSNSITGTPSSVFIIPAYAEHPGVAATRELEQNPGVIQVIKPQYPERLSVLEEKYEARKYEYEDIINEHRKLKDDNKDHLETIAVQQLLYKDLQTENSYRRAALQGCGEMDLAKFRNPIAEKEKKLDETQRDLDQKLMVTELALREAEKLQQSARAEFLKLENWKTAEEVKIQTALERNAALTAGVRAGYLQSAGTAPPITTPRVLGAMTPAALNNITTHPLTHKYGVIDDTAYAITDITDDVPPGPYPADLSGAITYLDDWGELVSQNIDLGTLSPVVRAADIADAVRWLERSEKIDKGTLLRPSGSLIRPNGSMIAITSLQGGANYKPALPPAP